MSYLSTEETSGRKIRGLCAISNSQGSIIQRLCKQQAFKRRTSGSLRCQEELLVLRLQQTMPQELSDHSSDTVMDVTDLADLDVYSELTTEGSSRLSTVEVFDTAMQLRGLVQSMTSSVPPVPHADDMLMYSECVHPSTFASIQSSRSPMPLMRRQNRPFVGWDQRRLRSRPKFS